MTDASLLFIPTLALVATDVAVQIIGVVLVEVRAVISVEVEATLVAVVTVMPVFVVSTQ